MTDTSIIDLDSDFVGFWRRNFNVLNGEIFGGLPSHRGLAGNGLFGA